MVALMDKQEVVVCGCDADRRVATDAPYYRLARTLSLRRASLHITGVV